MGKKDRQSWTDWYAEQELQAPRSVTFNGKKGSATMRDQWEPKTGKGKKSEFDGGSALDDYYSARAEEDLVAENNRLEGQYLDHVDETDGAKHHHSSQGSLLTTSYTSCRHAPQVVFQHDGIEFWGASESKIVEPDRFDLILNCTGWKPASSSKDAVKPESKKWAGLRRVFKAKSNIEAYVTLDWMDGKAPPVGREFWVAVLEQLKEQKATRMLAYCMGGHGRTGTALASLMTVALKVHGGKAIEAIRKGHCQKAVENKIQEAYVRRMTINADGTRKGKS